MMDDEHGREPGETPTETMRRHLRRRLLKKKRRLKAEAQAQGGARDMHDNPSRENRVLFRSTDLPIREPDAIRTAEELEAATVAEERRIHDDGDLEAVDDVRKIDSAIDDDFEAL